MNPWDYGTVCFCLGTFAVYQIHYYTATITRGSASHTVLSTNIKIALSWIRKHKEKGDAPNVTLAIQTLRNTILIAIFAGGFTLALGLSYSYAYTNIIGDEVLQLQHIIMCVCLLCSFLCWACVVRYSSHVGYYIGALSYIEIIKPKEHDRESMTNSHQKAIMDMDMEIEDNEVDLENQDMHLMIHCANMIALSLIFFNLGFRFIFITLPFAFFAMHRIGLFVATLIILVFLVGFDYSASYALFSKHDFKK